MPICSPSPRSIRPASASPGMPLSRARCASWPISARPNVRPCSRRCVHCTAILRSLAEVLDAPERSGAEHGFARLLRQALTAPGEDTLYAVGGKPVMAFWGFSTDAALPGAFIASRPPEPPLPVGQPRPVAATAPLAAHRATLPPVMASAPAVAGVLPATRSAWWQWVLLAVLLLSLLAFLAWLIRPYLPHLEPQSRRRRASRRCNWRCRSRRRSNRCAPIRWLTTMRDCGWNWRG